ncbi:kinase-like domain-containing protein [Glomus cerebriforme]|uniref:Kinase-like domain-containing protein n=1 Tax=Glomus cerebriforme TaxID=658196 RepID=A0A397S5X1_9GLOM|nr:kinase-like domain-containing protein [Glomus cerebriforme]
MEISKNKSEKKSRNLWKFVNTNRYQKHVTISTSTISSNNEIDERVIYIEDLEKRRQVYGICGECNEPGTGEAWCQPCNAKRFKDNFKNWTSGNKNIDELIQQSQLGAVYYQKYLEWIPFENFKDVTYITKGGFGKIYSAIWSKGYLSYWNIENQHWVRSSNVKVALKSLDNSSDISPDFYNEIKSHLQIHLHDVVQCYGISQVPNTKDYMMVLQYCDSGNLRNYYLNEFNSYYSKISYSFQIISGLLDIHNAGKIHRDFHSGNILRNANKYIYISDLGMCQPVNEHSVKKEGIYGVLPYMAPEVLQIPYNNIPHDHVLAIKICKGIRPKISEDTPKLLADLITKYKSKDIQTHPQAIYTSRLLNFKNLPEPVNSSYLSPFQFNSGDIKSRSISKCFDCQISESDFNEFNQDDENNIG